MAPRFSYGQFIRYKRKEKGWTQEDLRARSGLSSGTISALEGDRTNRTADTDEKIARAFETTVGRMRGEWEAWNPAPGAVSSDPDPLDRRATDRLSEDARVLGRVYDSLSRSRQHVALNVIFALRGEEDDKKT